MRVAEPIFAPWKAELALDFESIGDKTVLSGKSFDGPLVVQKPLYPEGEAICHAILVHPPAGIAGGDELCLRVKSKPRTSVLMTTPGAGKWYRSAGPRASQKLHFDVQGDLEWLPQETIVFDGALADMQCEVDLGAEGRRLADTDLWIKVEKDFTIYGEEVKFGGGKTVCATLLAAAPGIGAAVVAACREVEDVAVTLLPGLIVARHLGDSSEIAKKRLVQLWKTLRPAVHGRAAEEPRIWRT